MAWPTNTNKKDNDQLLQVAEEVVRKTWTFTHGKGSYSSDHLSEAGGGGPTKMSDIKVPSTMTLGEMRASAT